MWGWLTGKNAGKIIDGTKEIIDDAFFTAEEKSEAKAGVLKWLLQYQEATKPQNLARRLIAVLIVSLWVVLVLTATVSGYYETGEGSYSDFVFTVLGDVVNEPFMIVLGFYFLTHVVRAYRNGGGK